MKTVGANENGSPSDAQIAQALSEVQAQKGKGGRSKLTPEERERRANEAKAASEQKKLDRANKKLLKQKEREEKRKPAHMAKVQRAAERLPQLSSAAQEAVTGLFNAFPAEEITGIVAHTAHKLRVAATLTAQVVTLAEGMLVRIKDPASKFFGKLGRVSKAQRIRCYVRPLTSAKDIYLFTSNVEPVPESEASTDEGVDGLTVITSLTEPLQSVG